MSVYDMPRLETFGAVAKHYNSIDPVISKRHTRENDVRPLGDRRRKYERIHKFSDNCYAYYDGDMGDPIQYSDHHYHGKDIPMEASKALAPIMWTLEDDGTQILRVRNGSGTGAHNGRYSFLERALPREFNFVVDNGKQFVILNGVRYFLPKSEFYTWSYRRDTSIKQKDDCKYLEFQRTPDDRDWKIKTNSFMYVPPRVLVDKERKKKFKPAMDSYYSWLLVMAPMFREHLEHFQYDYHDQASQDRYQAKHNLAKLKRDELFEYAKEQEWLEEVQAVWGYEPKPEHALIIMEDEEHPMRMHMAWNMLLDSVLFDEHESERKKFRAHYNRWINKVCGFNKTIEAKVIANTEEK